MSENVGSLDLGVFFISGNAGQFVPHLNASTVDGFAIGRISIYTIAVMLLCNVLYPNSQAVAVVAKQTTLLS